MHKNSDPQNPALSTVLFDILKLTPLHSERPKLQAIFALKSLFVNNFFLILPI